MVHPLLIVLLALLFLPVGAAPVPPLATPPYRIYVTNEHSGEVSVIDGATGTETDRFYVGKRPRGVEVSADGSILYVATRDSARRAPGADPERGLSVVADRTADGIAMIDLHDRRLVRSIPVGSDPGEFALSRDGTRLIVANEDIGEASIWNIASGRRAARATVSGEPEGVTLHPVRNEIYVTCAEVGEVFVLDATDGREIARIRTGGRPRTIVFSPDGSEAYVPLETRSAIAIMDTDGHVVVGEVPVPRPALPMGAVISADGSEVYVSTGRGNTVAVLDTARREVVAVIPVGLDPGGIALSPDGKRLFTANRGSDDVSIVDVTARRELSRVPAGGGPWGVAIGPRRDAGQSAASKAGARGGGRTHKPLGGGGF